MKYRRGIEKLLRKSQAWRCSRAPFLTSWKTQKKQSLARSAEENRRKTVKNSCEDRQKEWKLTILEFIDVSLSTSCSYNLCTVSNCVLSPRLIFRGVQRRHPPQKVNVFCNLFWVSIVQQIRTKIALFPAAIELCGSWVWFVTIPAPRHFFPRAGKKANRIDCLFKTRQFW